MKKGITSGAINERIRRLSKLGVDRITLAGLMKMAFKKLKLTKKGWVDKDNDDDLLEETLKSIPTVREYKKVGFKPLKSALNAISDDLKNSWSDLKTIPSVLKESAKAVMEDPRLLKESMKSKRKKEREEQKLKEREEKKKAREEKKAQHKENLKRMGFLNQRISELISMGVVTPQQMSKALEGIEEVETTATGRLKVKEYSDETIALLKQYIPTVKDYIEDTNKFYEWQKEIAKIKDDDKRKKYRQELDNLIFTRRVNLDFETLKDEYYEFIDNTSDLNQTAKNEMSNLMKHIGSQHHYGKADLATINMALDYLRSKNMAGKGDIPRDEEDDTKDF